MSLLLDEAFIPALTRLKWNYIPVPDAPAVIVPFACDPPSSASVLVMIEVDDQRHEALLHTRLCTVPVGRRRAMALHLAALNTRFSFVTFSMGENGDVWLAVGVELFGTAVEMRTIVAEIGMRRLAQALEQTYHSVQRTALERQRRPRVEREVDAVLRGLE